MPRFQTWFHILPHEQWLALLFWKFLWILTTSLNIKALYICTVGSFDIRKLLKTLMKFIPLKILKENLFMILKKIVEFLIFYNIKNSNFWYQNSFSDIRYLNYCNRNTIFWYQRQTLKYPNGAEKKSNVVFFFVMRT